MTLVHLHRGRRNSLANLHNEMDDLFDSFFRGLDKPFVGYKAWPVIDIAEEKDVIFVKAEVPGCKANDIDISVHGNTLTISGEKKQEEQNKENGYYHIERSFGSFRRDLNLGSDIASDKIEATCKDGVLTIILPKAEKTKAIKVKVKG
ncbi:MAG: Hsp20/alpha crystallin family protein [Planctomycetota bacterium]